MAVTTLVFACALGLLLLGNVIGQDATCPEGQEYSDCGSACPPMCDNLSPSCISVCVPGCFCSTGTVLYNGACISADECPSATPSCPEGFEYTACGSPCNVTCANHEDPPVCTALCTSGCFCPAGTVVHNGACISPTECPTTPTITSCADSYEYNVCGSPCVTTCENYESPPLCTSVCQPGCFCPEGTVEHEGSCISTDECPQTCPETYEYNNCGSPCTKTCDNYDEESICASVCQPGCFCPEGTVEHEGSCISTDECPQTCPDTYEYNNCGSPCTKTCDNYDEVSFCASVCEPGCFCPEGTVEHEESCISTDECPQTCPETYEYKACGSPCTKTCDNYDEVSFCASVCEPGCFCPEGTVEHEESCISTDECPQTCPETYEYKQCGSPCTKTCDNYDEVSICAAVCVSGCFCPEGTVEHESQCITVEECPTDQPMCSGGKEWTECGTACPLTCENYEDPPACTRQCVPGCFCPQGKVDLNGVCVNSTTCTGCNYCREGQTCTAVKYQDYEYAQCLDPIAVPCSGSLPLSACAPSYRCIQHNTTGSRHCLQSCYLENGGCSDDQVCYYERKEEECNQLLEPCFKTACTDDPAGPGSCPVGWEIGPCGALCQRTCEDYVTGARLACPEICGPPDCVCPRGMVVFRDRCVDPLECYSLLHDEPDLNPLPLPEDSVLLAITLVGVEKEEVDGAQFTSEVQELVRELGFDDVSVSLFALLETEDGSVVIVLRFEGDSLDSKSSPDKLIDIMMENPGKLNHQVSSVRSVEDEETESEDTSSSLTGGAIAGVVIAVLISSMVVVVAVGVVVYLVLKSSRGATSPPDSKRVNEVELENSYEKLPSKEEMT